MMKEWADDRIKAMQGQIDFLEEQVGVPVAEICKAEDLRMAQKKVASKEKIVEFYGSLTGTTVAVNKDKRTFECMMTNPESGKAVSFSLRQKGGDVKFTPGDNAKFLPKDLQRKAEFDDSQLPFLLKEIYNTDMFKQDEDGGDGASVAESVNKVSVMQGN